MTDDVLLAEIIELAKSFSAVDNIGPNSRLLSDLHLDGDDAGDFMERFAGKHDVDMTGFVWLRHFGDEGVDMMGPAISMAACILSPSFALQWQAAHDAEREITINHLVDVARAKMWRDPDGTFRTSQKVSVIFLLFSAISVALMAFFFLIGLVVIYGFATGEFGNRNLLTLFGIAATSIFFPAFLAYSSWKSIQRKLASA